MLDAAQTKPAHTPRIPRLLRAPALLAAICFTLGDAVAQCFWAQPGHLLVALLLLFALTSLAVVRAQRVALVSAAALLTLLGLFAAEVQPSLPDSTPLMRIADAIPTPMTRRHHIRTTRIIQGTVVRTMPLRIFDSTAPYSTKLRIEQNREVDVRIVSVDSVPLPHPEGLRLNIYAPANVAFPAFDCGEALRGAVEMHPEEVFLDPGVWNARAWLQQQGISALGSAKFHDLTTARGSRGSFLCYIHSLQQAASQRLVAFAAHPAPWIPASLRLSSDDAAMLTSMLTGNRTLLNHQLRLGFERTGSFHLLVVSGMHLAIFAGIIFWIARRLRIRRGWATLATISLSFGYALFTGFGQPVQRAFWMVTVYLLARLLWRERRPLNAIGFAALALLAINPSALLNAGFQMTILSVVAVAGIAIPVAEATFAPFLHATRNLWLLPLDPALPPRLAQFRVVLRLIAESLRPLIGRRLALHVFPGCVRFLLLVAELLTTSLSIEVLMALPMAVYFHRITAVALPVNILIVPLLGILLPLALATFVLILILPTLAAIPAMAVALLLHGVSALIHLFGATRLGDIRIPGPTAPAIAAAIALILASLLLIRIRRWGLPLAFATLALASAITIWPRPIIHRAGALQISTIDVGQGDSILVITPQGKTLLIDAGGIVGPGDLSGNNPAQSSSNFDIGEDVVSPVLWSLGIRRLDAVAITHAHADHITGMLAVLANFHPRVLWVGINPHSRLYDAVLAEAAAVHTRIVKHTAGDVFPFGLVRVRVLAPEPDYRPAAWPQNNDSLVLQMRYGHTTALLEGDAEAASEKRMEARGDLHSDFLKVGHHGSNTSTTPAFLAAVSPSYAAISVGHRNFYGHPRWSVLNELQTAHVRTWRTDTLGMATFYLNGTTVQASTWAARKSAN